ncbi:MAG: hypothetical protein JJT94_14550 [Bernardetiaceae bacterium]|nr:hypothetical protein [Bernardetiaceae bacterium]
MENSPEIDGKYLGTITKDFVEVADKLKEAAYAIKAHKISDYPIFAISKTNIAIGKLLVGKSEADTLSWNYYASFVEEFVQRKLMSDEGLKLFQANYKNHEEFCCLFVVEPDFMNFVYVPYPEELD